MKRIVTLSLLALTASVALAKIPAPVLTDEANRDRVTMRFMRPPS